MSSDGRFEPHILENITIFHYNEHRPAAGSFPDAFFKGWAAIKVAANESNLECNGHRPMILPLPTGIGFLFDSLKGGNEDQQQIDNEVARLKAALTGVLKEYGVSKDHAIMACHVKKLYVQKSVQIV